MTQRVCISGAGSGIGRQTALKFAELGCDVTLVGRQEGHLRETASLVEEAGGHATIVVADLSTPESAEILRTALVGPYDAIIANAGGNAALRQDAPTLDGVHWASWHWEQNFRTNVFTAVHLIETIREMDGMAPNGSIVLLSSIAAYRGSGSGSYAGAKAALHPYAYDLARDLGVRGITVNVVVPGYISDTEFFRGTMTPDRQAALKDETLVHRNGTPDDIASTILWLCSPGARHITGQSIQVNGGARLG